MSSVRILCFGDSLTEGYSSWGQIYTPYASNMKAWLEAAWTSTTVSADVAGVSGDHVVSSYGFLSRIQSKCGQEAASYDWVIILGGTNDLAYGRTAEVVFEELKKVYQVALDHGANVLALTVPEAYSDELSTATTQSLNERRATLNRMILEHVAERYYAMDLHSMLPNSQLPQDVREEMWDDGIHLTPYGYGVMGDHIANQLVSIWPNVEEPKNLQAAGAGTEV